MELFTIGYEGSSIQAFLEVAVAAGIDKIVDVRELPLSRKAGFSKTALKGNLASVKIDYIHVGALGCPKAVRNRYRVDGNWTIYEGDFRKYLASQQETISEVAELSLLDTCALLCFEADYRKCHRSLVASAIQENNGIKITHLNSSHPEIGRLVWNFEPVLADR